MYEARQLNDFARPGDVSFDERDHNLVTLAMEGVGRLGRE